MIRSFCIVDGIQALVLAIVAWPVGMYLTADVREVYLITPHDPGAVELERFAFEGDFPDTSSISADNASHVDRVIRIYGNPTGATIRVLNVPDERLIYPTELPSLALLPQDKTAGDNVLQEQTVWFFVRWTSFAAGIGGLLLLGLWGLLTRLHRRANPKSPV